MCIRNFWLQTFKTLPNNMFFLDDKVYLICVLFMFTFLCLYVRGISGPFQASSKMEGSNAPS